MEDIARSASASPDIARRPSPVCALVTLALAATLAACAKTPANQQSTSPSPAQAKRGVHAVTAEGEEIVLAHPDHPHRPETEDTAIATRVDREHLVRVPTSPDPRAGRFTLEDAVVGLPIDGQLVVEIATDFGTTFCNLDAERAPLTVANFVGLARGLRPFWDAEAGGWVTRPLYRGLTFHRVVPGFLIQTGDPLEDGSSTFGYRIAAEHSDSRGVLHDRAGQLGMAFPGDSEKVGQFFLTDGPAPHLDAEPGYTVFGLCQPTDVIARIARVPQSGQPDNRPITPVRITRLRIQRVVGGAAAARPTPARLPEGVTMETLRGPQASPPPTALQNPGKRPALPAVPPPAPR